MERKRECLPRESFQLIGSPSVRKKVMNTHSSVSELLKRRRNWVHFKVPAVPHYLCLNKQEDNQSLPGN